jgi:polycystin 1L2
MKDYINFCQSDYSTKNEDTNNYGYSWSAYNESFEPLNGWPYIYQSFQYRNATSLDALSFPGMYDTYSGGGYIYQIRGKRSYLLGNLTVLENLGWIDRQTRAVFGEFAAYNPNVNLFIVCTIVVEFLASGNILVKSRFDPLDLFNGINGTSGFMIFCNTVYIGFICWFIVKELRMLLKQGRNYIGVWPLVEWGIIVSSLIGISLYVYRYKVALDILSFFAETSGYSYIKLQKVSEWNQVLQCCIGMCAFLGTLKFMKLLRFNVKVNYLISTLTRAAHDIFGFAVVFIVVWMAFVQLMYFIFVQKLMGYSTMIKAMMTSFQIMVGKFDVNGLVNANPILGPIIFTAFNVVVIFFLLNVFISLVSEAFEQERLLEKTSEKKYSLKEYFIIKWNKLVWKYGNNRKNILIDDKYLNLTNKEAYLTYLHLLPDKIDQVLYRVIQVKPFNLFN